MLNPFKEVNWNPGLKERRRFAISLVIGFPCIAAFLSIATRLATQAWKPFFLWLGVAGFAVGVLVRILPQYARPFYVAWYFFACCMGMVIGNLLFGAFFYLMLTPFGLVRRAVGKPGLTKGFDKSQPSYWRDAEKVVDLKRYYRQF